MTVSENKLVSLDTYRTTRNMKAATMVINQQQEEAITGFLKTTTAQDVAYINRVSGLGDAIASKIYLLCKVVRLVNESNKKLSDDQMKQLKISHAKLMVLTHKLRRAAQTGDAAAGLEWESFKTVFSAYEQNLKAE